MLTNELQEWYQNWRTKEGTYKSEELQDIYDRYSTLFTIYNKLYNQLPPRLKAKGYVLPNRLLDSVSSTQYVVNFLSASRIIDTLTKKNQADIEQIELLIEMEVFYIKIKNGERQRDKDQELLARLKSKNEEKKAIAILEVIYHVRCNMVHGSKDFQEYQKALLIPLTNILNSLLDLLYSSLNE